MTNNNFNISSPLISVIVPVYNVERYLKTCVDSVLSQTFSNWELILVNDGSPDNCPAICDEYAQKDKRIKVIHKVNGGVSSARNSALNNFKGQYVTFLDSDDFWHSDYLKIMLELCLENDADISQCTFVRGTEIFFPNIKNSAKSKVFNNQSILLSGNSKIILCAKLYKAYLFDNIRMPLGKINEDDFTTWKCYYKANKIAVTADALYYYTYNSDSIMSNVAKTPRLDFLEAYEERIEFFKEKDEKSMEDFSRAHFCKALLLTTNNKMLNPEQRQIVNSSFRENWKQIRFSQNINLSLRMLFLLFQISPKITLRIISFVR
jgi:glycosyltransferase involved in cell wall biosynthesis